MIEYLRKTSSYLNNKGFFDLLVAKFLVQFLGFGSLLLVAKLLSPTELGEIKIIQSYAAIFIILAGFGLNTAVLKICAEHSTLEYKEGVLKLALKRTLFSSFITLFLLSVLSCTGIVTSSKHLAFWLIIYSISIPIMVINDLFMVFLQAQKKIKLMARVQAIIKIQSVFIIIICTWIWGFSGFIFATIGAFAIGLVPLIWQVGINFIKTPVKGKIPHLTNYAVFSMFANLTYQIGKSGDIFILDHFLNDRETIGYYSLATIFLIGATQVTGVVQQIITPYFSENSSNRGWVVKNLYKNGLRMVVLSFCVAIVVYLVAWVIISLFFDAQYFIALKYLLILLMGYIIYSSQAINGAALLGLGLMRINFYIVLLSTPVTLMLLYIGLTNYGVVGIAWAGVFASVFKAFLSFSSLSLTLKFYYK